MDHVGSAHDDAGVAALKAIAEQRIHEGQDELDFGVSAGVGGPLPITSTRMTHLVDALVTGYEALGFEEATQSDSVFRGLVLARLIEPSSKLDSARVLQEAGLTAPSYATVKRRLPGYATEEFRAGLASACAARAALGPAALTLYDVSTLYFETDKADEFRVPGFSKERRLEPQITIGLLTDAAGFPLMVNAFEGNKAETLTMVPVLEAFQAVHGLTGITVVADAGMLSKANQEGLEAAGFTFILGARIPVLPPVVAEWQAANPGQEFVDGQLFTQPWPAGPKDERRDQVHYYQWKADRARRTLRGIDQQVAKAEQAVLGKVPVKRNRFIHLDGGTRSVNRDLEAKARALAGFKGYITNIENPTPGFVIGAYHDLFRIEKAFRMSKHDLAARPIYHHKRESIEAHLSIVFAALTVAHWIEVETGWSISRFIKTARRYRTLTIQAGTHTITAADPLPDDLSQALRAISTAH